jgi:uncharacterized membrane protein
MSVRNSISQIRRIPHFSKYEDRNTMFFISQNGGTILTDWIYRYYLEPIILDTGYNPVNTLTWAILLVISIFIIVRLFKHLDIVLDERLIFSTIPYILAGSSLRVIEDAELITQPAKYLLITPVIYFLVFFITIISLLICRKIFARKFYESYAAVGLLWTFINIIILLSVGVENIWAPIVVFCAGSAITGLVYLLITRLNFHFLENRCNLLILYSHMLDASSTWLGVDWLNYHEKHVVPTLLIDFSGTALVMFPLKLIVLLPVLSLIDESLREEASLRNLIKLALLILGLAPATRNVLRLTLGI